MATASSVTSTGSNHEVAITITTRLLVHKTGGKSFALPAGFIDNHPPSLAQYRKPAQGGNHVAR